MNLNQWAIKHGVTFEALEDLRREFGIVNTDPASNDYADSSEAAIQTLVRLEATRKGGRIWRNNVGATMDEYDNFIRYGLCNDSKQMNKIIKSADLIGIMPVTIEPHHVGQVIGQFIAREMKAGDWHYTGDAHELAQLKFLELVASLGGDAAFANNEGTL